MKRIEWVDIYKGLLIFLVVFGHALQGMASDHSLVSNSFYSSILYGKWLIYSFHMPAFFIAAGFFSTHLFKKINKTYFIKKVHRLVIPYFIWGFITAVCMQLAAGHTNSELGLKNFLCSPIVPFSIFWFLYVYFIIFLIHYTLSFFLKEKANYIILCLGIVLFIINPILPSFWIIKLLATYTIFYSIGLFTLSFVKRYVCVFSKNIYAILELILFVTAFCCYFHAMQDNNTLLSTYLMLFTSLTASAFFINVSIRISKRKNKFNELNDYFGKYSMQIYVVHLLPLAFSRIISLHYLKMTNLWLVAIFITIISLVVCWIVIELSNRLYLNKVFFGA